METYHEESHQQSDQQYTLPIFKQVHTYFSKLMAWYHNMNPRGFENMLSLLYKSWLNILGTVRKSHAVMRMKVNSNKVIYPDFIRNFLDGYRDDYGELPLVYPSVTLPLCQLQDLPCLRLVLIFLELIIGLIESACPILLLPNPDPPLCNLFSPSVILT